MGRRSPASSIFATCRSTAGLLVSNGSIALACTLFCLPLATRPLVGEKAPREMWAEGLGPPCRGVNGVLAGNTAAVRCWRLGQPDYHPHAVAAPWGLSLNWSRSAVSWLGASGSAAQPCGQEDQKHRVLTGWRATRESASTVAHGSCSSAGVSQCSLALCSRSGWPKWPLLFPGHKSSLQRVCQITKSGLLHPNGHLFLDGINLAAPHLLWLLTAAGRITKAFV